jgi:hypothetical protein
MCSRKQTEGQSAPPIAMSATHSQRCHRHPTPPPPNAVDEVGRHPSPPPQQRQRPPSCHQCRRSPPSWRNGAMEGPSSRPRHTAVSASGKRLQQVIQLMSSCCIEDIPHVRAPSSTVRQAVPYLYAPNLYCFSKSVPIQDNTILVTKILPFKPSQILCNNCTNSIVLLQ